MATVVIVVGIAAGLWALQKDTSGRARPAGPAETTPAEPEAGARRVTPESIAGTRQPVESPRLVIKVTGVDGRPLDATVAWRATSEPPSTADFLEGGAAAGIESLAVHAGEAEWAVPPGHWIWLQVTGAVELGGIVYRRIAPFSGVHEERIALSGEHGAIHVFLRDAELSDPVPDHPVQLHFRDMYTGAPPALQATRPTDANGYTCFERLAAGSYLVCAAGVRLDDGWPHVQSLMVAPGAAVQEAVCTLALPPPTRTVHFEVRGDFVPPHADNPIVVLIRKDDGSGRHYPLKVPIERNGREGTLRLQDGAYQVQVLPLGHFAIAGVDGPLRVGPGQPDRHRLTVTERPSSARLVLDGVGPRDLPVVVYPRPADDLLDDVPEQLYFGPLRWRSTEADVPEIDRPVRIVAKRSNGFWLSRDVVTLPAGRTVVPMEPASMLQVRWHTARRGGEAQPLIEVETRHGTLLHTLRRELVRQDGRIEASLVASVVVPRGAIVVRGLWSDRDDAAWARTLDATSAWTVIAAP